MSEENLSLSLVIVGRDEASASVRTVETSLADLQRQAVETGRALQRAFASMADSVLIAADRSKAMAAAVTGDLEEIKAAIPATFSGLALSASESSSAATGSMGRMASEIKAELDTIRTAAAFTFAPIAESMTVAVEGATAAFGRIDAAMASTTAQAKALAAEMRGLGISSPSTPGNEGLKNAARGHAGLHYRASGIEAPGGHIGLPSTPVMAAGAVAGYGIWEAMKARDEAVKLMLTGKVDPKDFGMTAEKLQREIQEGSALTGESHADVADAFLRAKRGMQGVDPAKQMDIAKSLLPIAEFEAKLKGTSIGESLQSIVELAHQVGEYDPAKLKTLASKFSIASLSVNSSLPEFGRTLSYSLPELHSGLGMDESTVIALTAASQNAGINSTKSGTWIRSLFEQSFPTTGKGSETHNAALKTLGLTDESGKPRWESLKPDGSKDWTASTLNVGKLVQEHVAGMDDATKLDTLRHAFGERGGAIASMLSSESFRSQFGGIAERLKGANPDSFRDYAENSPMVQANKAWRDLQNVMIDLGSTALPTVTTGLRAFDDVLKAMPSDWDATKKLWQDRWDALKGIVTGSDASPDKRPKTREEINRELQNGGRPDGRDESKSDAGLLKKSAYVTWDGPDSAVGILRSSDQSLRSQAVTLHDAMALWLDQAVSLRSIRDAITGKADEIKGNIAGGITDASYRTDDGAEGMTSLGAGRAGVRPPGDGRSRGYDDTSGGAESRNPNGSLLDRGRDVMARLMRIGVSREAAAGVAGNWQQESAISPNGKAGDHGTAHGLGQWRFERFAALKVFAARMQKPWTDLDAQIQFFVSEAKKRGHAAWLYGHSVEAANEGMRRYEQYGDHSEGRRLGNARQWMQQDPADIAATVSGSTSGGSHHHGDNVIHVHGITDPDAVAKTVTAKIEQQFRYRTHDVDHDVS